MVSPRIAEIRAKVRAKLVRYESTVSSVERVASLVLVTIAQASQPLQSGDHLALFTSAGRRRFTVCSATDATFSMIATVEHEGPAAAWLRHCRGGDRVMFGGPERGWKSRDLSDRDVVVCDTSGLGTMLALRGDRLLQIVLVVGPAAPNGGVTGVVHDADAMQSICRRWPGVVIANHDELEIQLNHRGGSVWAAGGKPLTDAARAITRKAGRTSHIRTYWAPRRAGME
jgi:NADPH-dependent ferric siderophore reductase